MKKTTLILLFNIIFIPIKPIAKRLITQLVNNAKEQFSGLRWQEKAKLGATFGGSILSFPWFYNEIMVKGQPEVTNPHIIKFEKENKIKRDKYIEDLNNNIKHINKEGINSTNVNDIVKKMAEMKTEMHQYLTPEEQKKYYIKYYNIANPTKLKYLLSAASIAIVGYLGFKLIKKILDRKKLSASKTITTPSNSVKILSNNKPLKLVTHLKY